MQYTLAKQKDACMNGLRSTIGIYGFHASKPQPLQKTPMRPDIICLGTRKFIDRDPHWYPCRVKEDTHIRLHPNNINRDSGIEISEAWMPTCTIRQHNSRSVPQGAAEETLFSSNNASNVSNRNPATISKVRNTPINNINNHGGANSHSVNRHYRLIETWSTRSKQRD